MKFAVIIVAAVFLFGVLEATSSYKLKDEPYEYRAIRRMRKPAKKALKQLTAAESELEPVALKYKTTADVSEPLGKVSESIKKVEELVKKVKKRGSKALKHIRKQMSKGKDDGDTPEE